jgi:dipeptidyl aminopeptidase/acylaminoacyl peptidase
MRLVSRDSIRLTVSVAIVVLAPIALGAQAPQTEADYTRALALREQFTNAAPGIADPATFIDGTSDFWYRRTVKGGREFVRVDTADQRKRPAFDHEKIAAALSKATGNSYTAATIPATGFRFVDAGNAFEVTADGSSWRCTIADAACRNVDAERGRRPGAQAPRPGADRPRLSPDGKWLAFVDNYNVAVRAFGSRDLTRLSADGSEGDAYDLASIVWSPDSTHVAAFRVRPGYRREVHYVESSPADQLQPKHSTRFYQKPGDILDVRQPVVFDVAQKRQLTIDPALFPNAYEISPLRWRKNSRALTFEYNQRGHQVYRVIEADPASGTARALISEEVKTFFNYRTANGTLADSGKKYRYDVDDGKEIVWMSERDGWNHLYLYDGVTGAVKNQITKGSWPVRGVVKVDEAKRQIWFSACGMNAGEDPYFLHYYRINFDGSGLTPLTGARANHAATFSPDMKYFVDTYSRVDVAPVMELRRADDASLVAEIERGDATALRAAGWRPPEVFTALGRDGRTDIWGVIFKPTTFDGAKKYPVIENIYAGPQGSFVPKSFSAYNQMQAQAELGFIVVQIDGMGTSNRSKAFQDVAFKNLKDAGFEDRILWHKAVAAKYPWYDVTRVGVYGTSAGGQNALGALLFHPEFYKAAVSAAGCHDNRMDKIWWNEQWMSWPLGPQYADSSNVENAYRLQGHLLMVVGEMDTNVDPSSTMQVVNQLIKHGKSFDLLYVPGMGHGSGGAYGERKRFDFFVQYLLGRTPPAWNEKSVKSATPTASGAEDDNPSAGEEEWRWIDPPAGGSE